MRVRRSAAVFIALRNQLRLLGGVEPRCVLRTVDQVKRGEQAQYDGRCTLDHEHPLPAEQTHHAAHIAHDPAGYEAAEHTRHATPAKKIDSTAARRRAGYQ
jgi:hypothetical protein